LINKLKLQLFSLMGQSLAFGSIDNAGERRSMALREILDNFQEELSRLQNPANCSAARKLVCTLNKACGFGCQIHHATYCFIVSYATKRTMVFLNDGYSWRYSAEGWNYAFLFCKLLQDGDRESEWGSDQAKVMSLPIVDSLINPPPYLPLAIPKSISQLLLTFHSNPPVFFVSMFLHYLMRPTPYISKRIAEAAEKIPFDKGPIVGIQIRRTDKVGTEAAFHPLSEYMKWAEHWFKIEEYRAKKKFERRVFIATDDSTVFSEARKTLALFFMFFSLYVCNYLVCTFSSQVCRVGYELMQARFGDAGNNFHSLDDIYYYGGQQAHEQIAVEAHKAKTNDEIDLEVGDVIGIAGNHWNGYSKGTNRRTGSFGLYPSYKVREKWIIVAFPEN
uniref:GT23 domain-containing protein n=1 Tax=Dracunculus medinensis TaxID=318479 RepID=A0A158Q517_DRAME